MFPIDLNTRSSFKTSLLVLHQQCTSVSPFALTRPLAVATMRMHGGTVLQAPGIAATALRLRPPKFSLLLLVSLATAIVLAVGTLALLAALVVGIVRLGASCEADRGQWELEQDMEPVNPP